MPRLARKYLESSFFHIICQGIDKESIFRTDSLKSAYKTFLKKNLLDTTAQILAYCIMDNHVHLLIYSENINEMSQIMHKTNTSYAKLYNKTYNRVGYVFRDRYYLQMILSEQQLYNCISYIHKNPLKAGIINKLSDYKYSSHVEYLHKKELLTSESLKLALGSDKNYLDIFNEIHKIDDIEDIKDINEEYTPPNVIINEFIEKTSKQLDEIKLDKELLGELLLQLRHSGRAFFKKYGKNS